jgi:hypothetical protein
MKKWHKIVLGIVAVVGALILLILIVPGGKMFWSQSVILPVAKPFSEACGYGGTSGREVQCACNGSLLAEETKGSTNYYCTGSCSQCKCYSINFQDGSKKEEDCAAFSQLDWAFPYNSQGQLKK